jgi:hypothetical protein
MNKYEDSLDNYSNVADDKKTDVLQDKLMDATEEPDQCHTGEEPVDATDIVDRIDHEDKQVEGLELIRNSIELRGSY